jgi:hypothetical protein
MQQGDGVKIMKTKLIAAALALLMTSGAAHAITQEDYARAFTKEQDYAIKTTLMANFAGNQKQNRCPRFRAIEKAMNAELAETAVTSEMLRVLRDSDFSRPESFVSVILAEYNKDPSAFCNEAWRSLGPNGTYKRQMLEAK